MIIRPVGVELFQTDGWTNKTKLTVTFHNLAKAPNDETTCSKLTVGSLLADQTCSVAAFTVILRET